MTQTQGAKCGARSIVRCNYGSHVCRLKKHHRGNHRCMLASNGSLNNPRTGGPCNFQWKNRKAWSWDALSTKKRIEHFMTDGYMR